MPQLAKMLMRGLLTLTIGDLKKSAAKRCAYPSTQSGCRAKRNADSSSWRTTPESQASRAADKARAPAEPADHEPPSNPPAKLRPTGSARQHPAEVLRSE